MVDEPIHDDSSYYEISITAGQAFLAVVLLIGSLAAAFAFGIIVGQARAREQPVAGPASSMIVEEPVDAATDFAGEETTPAPPSQSRPPVAEPQVIEEEPATPAIVESSQPEESAEPETPVPHVAQIVSTTDQENAESVAARLINDGFTNAYVERVPSDAGMIYRVRVRFPSESEARAAVDRLRSYSPGEIWVSKAE